MDFEEEFYKANKDCLCLEKPRRMAKIGYICDEECWIYELSVIGTSMSYFDEKFQKAKREM
ncbi:MAG: hypothetical protein RR880_05695 [Bacteroidales bacterium]